MMALWVLGCGFGAAPFADDGMEQVAALAGVEGDCADGLDDDGDGLIDCEDADCAAVCLEDCGDGTDDDSDGYIDCEDDDCWGVGDCSYAITRVHGGSMTHRRQTIGTSWWLSYSLYHGFGEEITSVVELADVWGTAEVWVADSSSWIACSWSFSAGTFQRLRRSTLGWDGLDSFSTSRFARSGGAVSEGCPSTSAFLPTQLSIDGARVSAGETRYSGVLTGYVHTFHSRGLRTDGGLGSTGFRETATWWTPELDAGGTHTAGWN